jgi:hypothetical protein
MMSQKIVRQHNWRDDCFKFNYVYSVSEECKDLCISRGNPTPDNFFVHDFYPFA